MTALTEISWPDAPRREQPTVSAAHQVLAGRGSGAQGPSSPSVLQSTHEPAAPLFTQGSPVASGFGLTTYQDRDSGRLVIRLFDQKSGDVLIEFPPEGRQAASYAKKPAVSTIPAASSGAGRTDLQV